MLDSMPIHKKDHPRVAAIVLAWNSADFITKALNSLEKSSYPVDALVVDNDSHDDTAAIITKKFPDIPQLNTGDNYGYAGGNNRGIKQVLKDKPDYIFIMNPDAYVDEDCLKMLVERMEQEPELALVSPKIYHDGSNDIWFGGGSKIVWRSGVTPQPGGKDVGQFDHEHYADWANGCAMLVRVSAIEKVGLMDERFFLYYEEVDWSVSFSEAGYKIGFQPDAKAWHKISSSTGGFISPLYQYYMTRNKLLFAARKRPAMLPSVLLFSIYDSLVKLNLVRKRSNMKTVWLIARAITKGYIDFGLRRFGKQQIPS